MTNWIGVGIWILLGAGIGLVMKGLVRLRHERPGHTLLLTVLGAFGAVVGGMLGVGIFEFDRPVALSAGGMGGAVAFAILITWIYRWGARSLT